MGKRKAHKKHTIGKPEPKTIQGKIVAWTPNNVVVRLGKQEFLIPRSAIYQVAEDDIERGYRVRSDWKVKGQARRRIIDRDEPIEIPKKIVSELKKRGILAGVS